MCESCIKLNYLSCTWQPVRPDEPLNSKLGSACGAGPSSAVGASTTPCLLRRVQALAGRIYACQRRSYSQPLGEQAPIAKHDKARMTDQPTVPAGVTADEALALIESGQFIAAIKPKLAKDPSSPLLAALIELHNADRVNLQDLLSTEAFTSTTGLRFYQVQSFFSEAIATIQATVPQMVAIVSSLDPTDGRSGGGYNRTAFRSWLDVNVARATEVIALAEDGNGNGRSVLSIAVQALGDLDEARRLINSTDEAIAREALHALAWMPHPEVSDRAATVAALARIGPEANDVLRGGALAAVVRVFNSAKAPLTADASDLIEKLVAGGGLRTLHEAAQALWSDPPTLDAKLVGILLKTLIDLDAAQADTLQSLDFGLHQVLDHGFDDDVIDFLTRLLGSSNSGLGLEAFDTTTSQILTRARALDRAIVAWSLAEGRVLGEGLANSLNHLDDADLRRALDIASLGFSDLKLYALCVRTIGFFYLQPVLAASILVSVLRTAKGDLAKRLEELLFDPLLVNYGGDMQAYLESVDNPDPAYRAVRRVLKRKKAYIAGLQAAGDIKELRPPERHRQAEFDRHSDEMRRSYDEAQKASPLLSMVGRSVILHGLKTVHVLIDKNGERRLTQSVMHSHSTTFEVPRSSILDPFGLEEMLLIFRSWKVPA